MLLVLLSFAGGVLTILSPCILPVLPFVFARSDRPFLRSGLPLLVGMVLTFGLTATLAAVGGGWAVQANQYGRWAAMLLLAFFGLTLLVPAIGDRIMQPLVNAGNRLSNYAQSGQQGSSEWLSALLLGIATGMLWAPCAGPILGLVLTGAALSGASVKTTLLLVAYAAGAATSLAIALLIGGRVFSAMKRSLGTSEWLRKVLGVAILCGVAMIALGLDTGLFAQLSSGKTASTEQALLDHFNAGGKPTSDQTMAPAVDKTGQAMAPMMMMAATHSKGSLPVEGPMPELTGAVKWLNSPELTPASLRGKVVLIDFWTYSCINCLRSLPYIQAWADKYRSQGLVVIGVHAPEFAFEKNLDNVEKATKDLGITYPVAVDNDYAIWRAFNNQYWPAHYFVDTKGQIRYHHFGEGDYEQSERIIQKLLAEAGHSDVDHNVVDPTANGVQMAPDEEALQSPETYVGYDRAENFANAGGQQHDQAHSYSIPKSLQLNQWGLTGSWKIMNEKAVALAPQARITYHFQARDLHLVLGPGAAGQQIKFRILIDGKAPGANHGMDVDANGNGTIRDERLYQLIRQSGDIKDHQFDIEFAAPGAEAFAFTFG